MASPRCPWQPLVSLGPALAVAARGNADFQERGGKRTALPRAPLPAVEESLPAAERGRGGGTEERASSTLATGVTQLAAVPVIAPKLSLWLVLCTTKHALNQQDSHLFPWEQGGTRNYFKPAACFLLTF